MNKLLFSLLLVIVFFSGSPLSISNASEIDTVNMSVTDTVKKDFKWGKYYEIPDLPYEIAVNSYKKGLLDVKVKDPAEGTMRMKIMPARNFVYIYEKDINQFGGWRCVQKTMYDDDSFVGEIATMSLSLLKEAGIVK